MHCPSVSATDEDHKIAFNMILERVDCVHEVRRLRIPITKITKTHMVASKYRLMHSTILLY